MIELPSRFNFKEVDNKWARYWEEKNCFSAKINQNKQPYTVVIPPPNVTGILHMGHALNNTLQDIIVRYKRMKGFETLWMPGTDHAGIATQNVVEKQLAKEGKRRQDIGREVFLQRLWAWKREYGDTIIRQLKRLGSSCDWQRIRFTMDEDYCKAVRYVFVRLYQKGLIYRGEYIINWCPRCLTALSDEEAEHKDTEGFLYYIRYPIKDTDEYLTVATTRPETMLGDTAVAVNPNDSRYTHLVGKIVVLPLIGRHIPVIADEFVDPEFGTGAVKVTPAHDPNDFLMGERHGLRVINIMHPDARLNEQAGEFAGMDRFEAREAIVDELKQRKLLEKITPHMHAVGHCYRCHTVVEPYLSKQWFVKMKPLAEPAITVVKEGRIKFHPERWTKVYMNWMENIRDWCISRQIWWGHRIPVWYCKNCENDDNVIVSEIEPQQCPKCGSKDIYQDEDVLDTWFSSWLWPFATFRWPLPDGKIAPDLQYFYPTSALFTAPEIIFFWVARMIMAGLEFMGDIPFSDVYIHGTVRDSKGRKMSKSLGNAIDPLEIIEEYGADALRFSLIVNSGQDIFISKDKFEIGRNFANKVWNASRLILMHIDLSNLKRSESGDNYLYDIKIEDKDLASKWIVSRFFNTVKHVSNAIERYRFSEAETLVQDFFWGELCDWYLEIIKERWDEEYIQHVALALLEGSLKILHPFMPFVTEEIWSRFKGKDNPLCIQPWPDIEKEKIDVKVEADMKFVIDVIGALRNIRARWNIKPKDKIDCQFVSEDIMSLSLLEQNSNMLRTFAKVNEIAVGEISGNDISASATVVIGKVKCIVPLSGLINIEEEKQRIIADIKANERIASSLSARLQNKNFLNKAPQEVIQKERMRFEEMELKIKELKRALAELG